MTLEIPEIVEKALGKNPEEARRRALECMLLDAYKSRKLSRGQVRSLLGLTWQATEEFLAKNGATYHYSATDLDEDIETGKQLLNLSEPDRR